MQVSEFVECQSCGRSFFAENLVCPYCRGGGEADDDADDVVSEAERFLRRAGGRRAGTSGLYAVLFIGFELALVAIAVISLVALGRPRASQALLALEATAALVVLVGLVRRRRWGRSLAILFILVHAALGIAAVLGRGSAASLFWGPGPLALLLFLLPFLSPQARERFDR